MTKVFWLCKCRSMSQAADDVKPKRARRAKTAQAELPGAVDGGEDEDVAEVVEKPKKRRGKQPDPNAPPPFGKLSPRCTHTCFHAGSRISDHLNDCIEMYSSHLEIH